MTSVVPRFAVIGNPIAHSRSPRIHELFGASLGVALDYQRLLCPLDSFPTLIQQLREQGYAGVNVTLPFKSEAIACATDASASATECCASNTLSFRSAGIYADNTDGSGLVRDLLTNHRFELDGARVLLLGAGGAARGVVGSLLRAGVAQLDLFNRTRTRAEDIVVTFARLAAHQSVPIASVSEGVVADSEYDLVINATSAGLGEGIPALPTAHYSEDGLAYDMVYGRETGFMYEAGLRGARVADGLGMLVEQAADAFEIWHGARPATGAAMSALREDIQAESRK